MNDRFTLRCAVYAFIIKDHKLLLMRRKNTGWKDGLYGVPAGHLEANESVLDALIREVKEEANINIKKEDVKLVHSMYRKSNHSYVDLFFLVNMWSGEAIINEKDKADDLGWFDTNSLPENTLEHVKKAFENYENGIYFSEIEYL